MLTATFLSRSQDVLCWAVNPCFYTSNDFHSGNSSGQLGCSLGRACGRRNSTTAALSQMSCLNVNRCGCLSSFLIPQEGEAASSVPHAPNPPVLAGCRADRYGPGCSLRCQCAGRARCDPKNGNCACPGSWRGPACTEGNQPGVQPSLGDKTPLAPAGGQCGWEGEPIRMFGSFLFLMK